MRWRRRSSGEVLAAQVRVEPGGRLDPVSAAMAASPLTGTRPLPGPPVLGFIACGAVVRRDAYLAVGGFDPLLHFTCEEGLLALDLAVAGWDLAYAADVVAHHQPSPTSSRTRRQALVRRNDLLTAWMRRRLGVAAAATAATVAGALHDPAARRALAGLLRRLPQALARRHPVPEGLERQLRMLDH